MDIQTEVTPNPSSLKFLPGKIVMEKGTADFRNVEEAKRSPFALNLFKIDGVEGVFLVQILFRLQKTIIMNGKCSSLQFLKLL